MSAGAPSRTSRAQPSAPCAGGETRLVSLPFHSDFHTLMEALERTTAPLGAASAGAGGSADTASDAAPRTFVSRCGSLGAQGAGGVWDCCKDCNPLPPSPWARCAAWCLVRQRALCLLLLGPSRPCLGPSWAPAALSPRRRASLHVGAHPCSATTAGKVLSPFQHAKAGSAPPGCPAPAPLVQSPQVKYRLPSDPSVWVDVMDDEDVAVGAARPGPGRAACRIGPGLSRADCSLGLEPVSLSSLAVSSA